MHIFPAHTQIGTTIAWAYFSECAAAMYLGHDCFNKNNSNNNYWAQRTCNIFSSPTLTAVWRGVSPLSSWTWTLAPLLSNICTIRRCFPRIALCNAVRPNSSVALRSVNKTVLCLLADSDSYLLSSISNARGRGGGRGREVISQNTKSTEGTSTWLKKSPTPPTQHQWVSKLWLIHSNYDLFQLALTVAFFNYMYILETSLDRKIEVNLTSTRGNSFHIKPLSAITKSKSHWAAL